MLDYTTHERYEKYILLLSLVVIVALCFAAAMHEHNRPPQSVQSTRTTEK